ncbi:MAG: lipopolysaccharide biosynthesis protein [Candidatus Omnitrophota bacterium]
MTEPHLKSKVVKGAWWAFLERLLPQMIMLFITPFLARILSPKEFGIFALACVCVGFLDLFSDYGFGSAIIQKKNLQEVDKKTAFLFSCVVGTILFVGMFFLAKPLALFLHEPQLSLLLKVIAISFLLSPFIGIHNALLQRHMQFRSLTKAKVSGVFVYGVVALVMALMGFGVWALVCAFLAEHVVRVGVLSYYSRWHYCFGYSKESIKHFFNYGIYLFLFRICNYLSMQLDKIIIGRSIGVNMLGYYSMADNVSKKIFTFMGIPLGKVLFPAFSTIHENNQRMKNIIVEVYKHISYIVLPLSFGLFCIAHEVVLLFLGPKWVQSVIFIRILSVSGGCMVLGGLVGSVFLATARTEIHFKLGLFNSIVRIVAVIIGACWGAIGMAVGLVIIQIGMMFWNPYIMCRIIGLKYKSLVIVILKPLAMSLVMVGGILFIGIFLPVQNYFFANLSNLIIKTIFGATSYICLNRLFGCYLDKSIISMVKRAVQNK